MSYARMGPDSDVYVYRHIQGGFICCACGLKPKGGDPTFEDYGGIIRHLDDHSAAGDKVPARTLHRLRAEQDEINEVPQ